MTILADLPDLFEEQLRPATRKESHVKFQPEFLNRFEEHLRLERRKDDWEALALFVGCAVLFGLAAVFLR